MTPQERKEMRRLGQHLLEASHAPDEELEEDEVFDDEEWTERDRSAELIDRLLTAVVIAVIVLGFGLTFLDWIREALAGGG